MTETPDWLAEVLHVVKGFADREHEGTLRALTPDHAQDALSNVPADVLRAVGIQSAVARP